MNALSLVIGNKNYSSWSLRAWLYLAVNDIPFDEIFLPLDTPEFQSEIGQYSATRCVPVLIDNESKICDSLAIIEYLNRHFPTSVGWPNDRKLEALALSAVAEMHSGFNALRGNYPMNCRQDPFKAPLLGNVERDIARLDQLWQDLMDASGNVGPGLLGPLSIVDVYFAPVVFRCRTYQFNLSDRSMKYIGTMLGLPAMQAWAAAASQEVEIVEADEFHLIHA
jgi:glutathione S-transferase